MALPNNSKNLTFCFLLKTFPSSLSQLSQLVYLCVTLDSSLTFSEHITQLTRTSYFQLRRIKAIRRSVSSSTLTSIVHAFVCSRIDYCNSVLVGLSKVRLSPIQSVLNAAARLIAHPHKFSHISSSMECPSLLCMCYHSLWVSSYSLLPPQNLLLLWGSRTGSATEWSLL